MPWTFGSVWRFREATTSSAVIFDPSQNVTPSRSVKISVRGSGCSCDSARFGSTLKSGWTCIRPSHRFETTVPAERSPVRAGSSVVGSPVESAHVTRSTSPVAGGVRTVSLPRPAAASPPVRPSAPSLPSLPPQPAAALAPKSSAAVISAALRRVRNSMERPLSCLPRWTGRVPRPAGQMSGYLRPTGDATAFYHILASRLAGCRVTLHNTVASRLDLRTAMSTEPRPTPAADELWRWSAAALAGAIRTREVSSVEAVTACLERTARVNPDVSALVDVQAERALAAAREADRVVASGGPTGALHGVPISVKDNVDEAGLRNSGGLRITEGTVAAQDAPVVANLRAAGAISIGRSNVPAFSLRWFSDNDVYGRTLNPFDPTKTPGGSSGGAAAALAAGMVSLAHGNDVGGSVRYPAHVCGVMGLRPTVGRIPSFVEASEHLPGLPPSPMLMAVEGVLARTVADLSLGLEAMAVPDLRDPACVPAPFARSAPVERGATIGLVRGTGEPALDPSHDRALDAAAAWLRDAGYGVEELALPQLAEAHALWIVLLHTEMQLDLPMFEALGGEAIVRSMRNTFALMEERFGPASLEGYVRAHARRSALITEVQAVLGRYPAILMPASGAPAPDHDADLDAETARALILAQWPNGAVPVLGLPALTLPTGLEGGLPTGVQLLGGRFGESALLDVAAAIEERAPRLAPIDPVTAAAAGA